MPNNRNPVQSELPLGDNKDVTPAITFRPRQPGIMRQVALVTAGGGALLWGVWATQAITTLRDTAPHLEKVELADLVREFVQREARSGEPAEKITAHTATFFKALNDAVGAHARRGAVVLLGNAVVDGDVPDITAKVRAEVYSQLPPGAEAPHAPANDKAAESEAGHGQSH